MPANQKLTNYLADIKERTFARADRFEVTFNIGNLGRAMSANIAPMGGSTEETIQLYCEEVQIPGMILSNKEFNIGAWTFYRNTKVGFLGNEINFTFLTTNDWELRGFFEQWMKLCVDTNGQEIGFPEDVMCTIDIKALDVQDNVTKGWRLYEAMPKVLNLVPLSSSTTAPVRNTLIVSSAYWESTDSERSNGLSTFQPQQDSQSNIAGEYDDKAALRNVQIPLKDVNAQRLLELYSKNGQLGDGPGKQWPASQLKNENHPNSVLTDMKGIQSEHGQDVVSTGVSTLPLQHDDNKPVSGPPAPGAGAGSLQIQSKHGKNVAGSGAKDLPLQHDDNMLASGPMQPSKSRGGLSIESDHGKKVQTDGLHTLEERSERGSGRGLFSFFGL